MVHYWSNCITYFFSYIFRRSDTISSFMLTDNVSPIMTPQFYDATKVIEVNPVAIKSITWVAFPKKVHRAFLSLHMFAYAEIGQT